MNGIEDRNVTCAKCSRTYETTTTLAEANQEFLETFGPIPESLKRVHLCDPCYKEFMAWFKERNANQ